MGSDGQERVVRPDPCISIHAPAWGATVANTMRYLFDPIFQSTLPHGERPAQVYLFNGLCTGLSRGC